MRVPSLADGRVPILDVILQRGSTCGAAGSRRAPTWIVSRLRQHARALWMSHRAARRAARGWKYRSQL